MKSSSKYELSWTNKWQFLSSSLIRFSKKSPHLNNANSIAMFGSPKSINIYVYLLECAVRSIKVSNFSSANDIGVCSFRLSERKKQVHWLAQLSFSYRSSSTSRAHTTHVIHHVIVIRRDTPIYSHILLFSRFTDRPTNEDFSCDCRPLRVVSCKYLQMIFFFFFSTKRANRDVGWCSVRKREVRQNTFFLRHFAPRSTKRIWQQWESRESVRFSCLSRRLIARKAIWECWKKCETKIQRQRWRRMWIETRLNSIKVENP